MHGAAGRLGTHCINSTRPASHELGIQWLAYHRGTGQVEGALAGSGGLYQPGRWYTVTDCGWPCMNMWDCLMGLSALSHVGTIEEGQAGLAGNKWRRSREGGTEAQGLSIEVGQAT